MAKILVADDNSNVQKTVALALADLGIEVVAVNNGEAAVKKLPDVMPDLVLADIFMPVRNGYEVCEYVKKDSRFSHLPVVLLVGAFDPLDEREAQRVGADGILKKPFVPPDPLIAMVKTLLDRTLGDRLVTAAVSKPAASKQARSGGVAIAEDHEAGTSVSEEETTRPAANHLSFGDGDRPVAFSQLLDAPEMAVSPSTTQMDEQEDNDQILTSARDEALGAPIFWKTESPEQDLNARDSDAEADESDEIPAVGWRLGNELEASPVAPEAKNSEEPLELVLDEKDSVANQISSVIEPSPLHLQDAAAQASLNVEASKAEDLAANPLEWMASVPPPREEEVPANISQWSSLVPEPADHLETKLPDQVGPAAGFAAVELPDVSAPLISSSPEAISATQPETTPSIPEHSNSEAEGMDAVAVQPSAEPQQTAAPSVKDTVRSISKQDWSDLATSIQTPATPPEQQDVTKSATPQKDEHAVVHAAVIPVPWSSMPAEVNLAAARVEDTAHSLPKHDWADLVSDLKPSSNHLDADRIQNAPVSLNQPAASSQTNSQPVSPVDMPGAIAEAITSSAPKASKSSVEDTARSLPKLDWADLAANLQPRTSDPTSEKAKSATPAVGNAPTAPPVNGKSSSISEAATASEGTLNHQADAANSVTTVPGATDSTTLGVPDPALVEAVVQRVLDKMRPQVVDIITKEFLRPVVQALVHREITKR